MIYTEEIKREIESHGMMVIEFKMMIKKGTAFITMIADKIVIAFQKIIGAFKELSDKFIELIEEHIIPIKKCFEKLLRKQNVKNKRYRVIRNIKIGYRLIVKRPVMIHCRNNC